MLGVAGVGKKVGVDVGVARGLGDRALDLADGRDGGVAAEGQGPAQALSLKNIS